MTKQIERPIGQADFSRYVEFGLQTAADGEASFKGDLGDLCNDLFGIYAQDICRCTVHEV